MQAQFANCVQFDLVIFNLFRNEMNRDTSVNTSVNDSAVHAIKLSACYHGNSPLEISSTKYRYVL